MSAVQRIAYHVILPNGAIHRIVLSLDPASLEICEPVPAALPDWTRLEFERCSSCPLAATAGARCPAAVRLAPVIEGWLDVVSYDRVQVRVEMAERTITAELPAQQALASILGLVLATSGCPRTAVFRPMARFHLPFASESETAYRAAAMYLMSQYFAARDGRPADIELAGLGRLYEDLHAVNRGLARRLRAASRQDAVINAIVLLGGYASLLPAALDELLEEVRPAFSALLDS
jgi:Domain of unknown function (DUF6901)